MTRYAGLFPIPAKNLGQTFVYPSDRKRSYYAILSHSRPFSSNIVTLKRKEKNQTKNRTIKKIKKNLEN